MHASRFAACAVSLIAAVAGAAPTVDDEAALSVLLENDAFAATDRHYTNGIEISYLTAPRPMNGYAAALIDWLPGNENGETRVGWQLGQTLYTPDDKEALELLPDERPYAAWLYGGISVLYATDSHIDTWSLHFGTLGPDAKGAELQNRVHEWLDATNANGWDNQLGDQRGGMLIVQRKWRAMAQTDVYRFGFDFMPHIGVSLGNIEQYANAGLSMRIGNDLDNDFGPPRIRPSLPGTAYFVPHDRWSWYLFAGVEGRYVDKNIFLDDHPDREQWNIWKTDWVAEAQGGFVMTRGDFRLAYTYVYRSKEFKQQLEPDRFGSLALTWRF